MFGIRSEAPSTTQRRVFAIAAAMATMATVQTFSAHIASADTPVGCATVQGNLVQDCGFEDVAKNDRVQDPSDWVHDNEQNAGANYAGDVTANSGNSYFSFGSSTADGPQDGDSIEQKLATTPGVTYAVTFWIENDKLTDQTEPGVHAWIDNDDANDENLLVLDNVQPVANPQWVEYTKYYTADNSQPTIHFEGQSPDGWMNLDDIAVAPDQPSGVRNPYGPVTPISTTTQPSTPTPPAPAPAPTTPIRSGVPGNPFPTLPGGSTTTTPAPTRGQLPPQGTVVPPAQPTTPTVPTTSAPMPPAPPVTAQVPGAVVNPGITATVSSDYDESDGWYSAPVTVSFSCTAGSSAFASACPAPITFSQDKVDGAVTAAVADTDGGHASVTTDTIRIDLDAPSLSVTRHAGQCVASDGLSGVASCVIHRSRHGLKVTWTATAVDNAGNVSQLKGSYRAL